jgi:hypothetical protein
LEVARIGRATRIHGELLNLGFEVAQSSVAKYMVKRRGPPSQGWRTFLRNHAPAAAKADARQEKLLKLLAEEVANEPPPRKN